MSLQSGRNDEAVGGIAVYVRKQTGARRDYAVNRNFHQSLVKQVAPPSVHIKAQNQPAFLDLHTNFPKGYSRYGNIALLQRTLKQEAGLRSQPPVASLMP